MRTLIINADDVGFSREINTAVKDCYEKDILTGVSIMACGEYFKEAADILRGINKLETGAHLTLTGKFCPCTKENSAVSSILKSEGTFEADYKGLFLRYYKKELELSQVKKEFSNQIENIQQEGFTITHLDTHEHIHLFPGIMKLLIVLAEEYKVPYIRIPLETRKIINIQFALKDLLRHTALKHFSVKAKKLIVNTKAVSNDVFWGHFHSGRMDDDILCYMMKNLTNGINELAVHPAVESADFTGKYPWYRNSGAELNALLNGKWQNFAAERKIRFVSHKQAVESI
ncbi:MAG: ChbG/HpnK family deacetylase [Candidatus Omnitrophota bacterium]